MPNLEDAIARGKEEILADMADGTVPSDVATFSALHDYVDANVYAGLCDGDEIDVDFANSVQDALHAWLASGGARG